MEHRCGHRRAVTAPVILRTRSGLAAEGQIQDLSSSGALVRTPLPLPLHTCVLVQFPRVSQDSPLRRPLVSGTIIRHVEDGFAIEWMEFSPVPVRNFMRRRFETQDETASRTSRAGAR
jgi:hypothetical protein